MANFSSQASYAAAVRSLRWQDNGDIVLTVTVTRSAVEVGQRSFIFTAAGRVVSHAGVDLGAVPNGFATGLATVATKLATAIQSLVDAGHLDP